jgi:glycosyltransferase involved in cell wall biosynthesis
VRVAVFTSKYPARVATFFERDMRGLIEAGVEIEVFPIYPLDPRMWRYSLDVLSESVLPRERVHHLSLAQTLGGLRPWSPLKVAGALADAARMIGSALRFGPVAAAKTTYVIPKAWTWAERHPDDFDHVLAYWGNYAASCAYAFHRLTNGRTPFSIWLHAGTDLYFQPVFLKQKLLHADSIITCCDFNRAFVETEFPDIAPRVRDKIHVAYHGLALADFPYRPDGRPPARVLAAGRLAADKGFDYLLRAAAAVLQQGIALDVEILGDGPEGGTLRALAANLGIRERVSFRGWVPFSEVHRAMQQATVLVHPSAGLGDGLPNVIREAMALGTPVVASQIAGIPEALDDGRCGLLVPTKDADALARGLTQVLTDAPLRRTYAERARRRTEQLFDMWRNGAHLAAHLRSVRRSTSPVPSVAVRAVGLPEAGEPPC